MPTDEFKKLLKCREVAELLGVSERWVWFRVKEGTLLVIRLGGVKRIPLSDLERFVECEKHVES